MIKGDFHFHSQHSCCQSDHYVGHFVDYKKSCGIGAAAEIIELTKEAKKKGFEYITLTNHATDPVSGKKADKKEIKILLEHINQIQKLNNDNKYKIKIIGGVEVDIIDDKGNLSVPDRILKKMDIVIASLHRPIELLTLKEIKNGFLRALKNQHVDIIGHPTRFINQLDKEDWQEIMETCQKEKKVFEYNVRAPLSSKLVGILKRSRAVVSIGSDFHLEQIKKVSKSLSLFASGYIENLKKEYQALLSLGIPEKKIINSYSKKRIREFFNF